MSALKKVLYAIDRVVFKIAYGIEFLTTAVLLIAVTLQVFTRYVLRSPLRWTTELCCFMLIYSVLSAAQLLYARENMFTWIFPR